MRSCAPSATHRRSATKNSAPSGLTRKLPAKARSSSTKRPIGNFCEIEGPPRWIDATAKKLGVDAADYITKNYATLFAEWKQQTNSTAKEMIFNKIGR